jgi:hypothetical protein
MRYEMERDRFSKLCGAAEILKTADLIAWSGWYSFRHCVKRVKALAKDQRKHAFRLLRAAQWQRKNPGDAAMAWLLGRIDSQVDFMQFFVAPIGAEVYVDRLQPIVDESGEIIGRTLRADRIKGGRVRIYYKSKLQEAVEFARAEPAKLSTGSGHLDSLGFFNARTTFHVKRKKLTAQNGVK